MGSTNALIGSSDSDIVENVNHLRSESLGGISNCFGEGKDFLCVGRLVVLVGEVDNSISESGIRSSHCIRVDRTSNEEIHIRNSSSTIRKESSPGKNNSEEGICIGEVRRHIEVEGG